MWMHKEGIGIFQREIPFFERLAEGQSRKTSNYIPRYSIQIPENKKNTANKVVDFKKTILKRYNPYFLKISK